MSVSPGVIRTNAATILTAVAARLLFKKVVQDATRVLFVSRRDPIPHFGGEQDVLLRPKGFQVDSAQDQFAGRVTTLLRRQLWVTGRTRYALDQANRDQIWLNDPVKGHLALEEAIADALHEWWPSLDNGYTFLTVQPLKLISGDDPNRENEDKAWGGSTVPFSMNYYLALNQADQ